jgi:DNA-binding transcriptional LysR family regulator
MDARQMEYVVAIAEERSFTRAAARCHIAQSALSHQVARLETEVGARIFDRTSRSVRLSEAGVILLPYARQILDNLAGARNALDRHHGLTRGRLRIGLTQTAGRGLDLITLIGDVHRRYPDISLSTVTGPGRELIDAVRDGQLDIAAAAAPIEGWPDGVTFQPLIDEPLVAVVASGHRLARRKQIRLEELSDSGPFVEFVPGTALRDQVDGAFAAAGVRRTSSFQVGQITDMIHYAANGLGTAIVPRAFTLGNSMFSGSGSVHVFKLVAPTIHLQIGTFRRPDRPSPALDALVACLPGAQ